MEIVLQAGTDDTGRGVQLDASTKAGSGECGGGQLRPLHLEIELVDHVLAELADLFAPFGAAVDIDAGT